MRASGFARNAQFVRSHHCCLVSALARRRVWGDSEDVEVLDALDQLIACIDERSELGEVGQGPVGVQRVPGDAGKHVGHQREAEA